MTLFASFHIITEVIHKVIGTPDIREMFVNDFFVIDELTPEKIKEIENAIENKYGFAAQEKGLKVRIKATMITPMILPEEKKSIIEKV